MLQNDVEAGVVQVLRLNSGDSAAHAVMCSAARAPDLGRCCGRHPPSPRRCWRRWRPRPAGCYWNRRPLGILAVVSVSAVLYQSPGLPALSH